MAMQTRRRHGGSFSLCNITIIKKRKFKKNHFDSIFTSFNTPISQEARIFFPSFQIIMRNAILGSYLALKLEPMAENWVKKPFFTITFFFDPHVCTYSRHGVIQMKFFTMVRIMTNEYQMASHGDSHMAAWWLLIDTVLNHPLKPLIMKKNHINFIFGSINMRISRASPILIQFFI